MVERFLKKKYKKGAMQCSDKGAESCSHTRTDTQTQTDTYRHTDKYRHTSQPKPTTPTHTPALAHPNPYANTPAWIPDKPLARPRVRRRGRRTRPARTGTHGPGRHTHASATPEPSSIMLHGESGGGGRRTNSSDLGSYHSETSRGSRSPTVL